MWRVLSIFSCVLVSAFALVSNVKAADESTPGTTTTEVTTSTAPIATSTTTTVERHVIVTAVPAPKVIVTAPGNYVSCFKVEAGWHGDSWVPEHQICQYENSPEGVAWVEGYWSCAQYKADTGDCTSWNWTDAHWVKVLDVY